VGNPGSLQYSARVQRPADVALPQADVLPRITVLLVTDAPLLRDGLGQMLANVRSIDVVGTAAELGDALVAVATLSPAVVLLDMSTARCVEIARALRALAPAIGIVAFALDLSDDDQLVCVEAGITGFVSRNGGVRELVDAARCVARGDAVCTPQAVAAAFRRLVELSANRVTTAADGAQPLSARELEIVELIDGGLTNKEIAKRLSIGVATVKNHVHHILEKLNVSTRGEAVARLRQISARLPSLAPARIGRPEYTSAPDSRA